ncbi:MAG: hypothetical protein ACI8S6_003931 [Myxococcota bacterium]|jgi:hypothetical protein
MSIALLAMLTGCAPQDAEVTATWFTWLAANSSPTVAEGKLDDTFKREGKAIECSGRGWDSDEDDFDFGYIGPGTRLAEASEYIGGDCDPDDSGCDSDALDDQCAPIDGLEYFTFIQDDGFYALEGTIKPDTDSAAYRTEAYLNSENDFQLTVHQRLDNGEDFRFHFTIAPDFAPLDCLEDEAGSPQIEYVDGSDWVDEWSADEDGYSVYYMNAGTYQLNPSDTDIFWFLTTDWLSGFGEAKFAAEEFTSVPGSYGDYDHLAQYENRSLDPVTVNSAHFLAVDDREAPDSAQYENSYETLREKSDIWATEMSDTLGATGYTHKTESNDWREIDLSNAGVDGWMEMHPSWVRVKNGASFELGSAIEGDFQIIYQGRESGSRLVVQGSFKVDSLREDPWGYPFLEDEKRGENTTPFCGGAAAP